MTNKIFSKINIVIASIALIGGVAGLVYAASTSNFTQVINPGTLTADIIDGSNVTVASPSVTMSPTTFSFNTQTVTGTFGSAAQQIYIANPDAADNGWTLSLAALAPTDVWASAGTPFDFNDANGSGYTDGADIDAVGGQLTVNPSVGTLSTATCLSCTTASVTKGNSATFIEGSVDSVTILSGAAGSSDVGNWKLTGVSLNQKIPAEQPAASDYNINMVLSVVAI